jgi:hypothetical protein
LLSFDIMTSETVHAPGTANNAGAILVGRELVIVPKLIHPLPPPVNSPESPPEHGDAAWMQVRLNILFVVKIGLGCK